MNTLETCEQDYQIAARELSALWGKTGLAHKITCLRADIDETGDKHWPHVAMCVEFYNAGKLVGSLDWKMGTGLIDWKLAARNCFGPQNRGLAEAMAKHASLLPEAKIQACNSALSMFAKAVNPAEVLACAARDAIDAEMPFKDWASEFGYDSDSRKAESVYFACQNGGIAARKILAGTGVSLHDLAELSSRL